MEDQHQEDLKIRQMLQASFDEEGRNLNIEDDILKLITVQKDRSMELRKLKKRALIGFSISAVAVLIYIVYNLQWSVPSSNQPIMEPGLSFLFYSIAPIIAVFIILLQGALLFSNHSKSF